MLSLNLFLNFFSVAVIPLNARGGFETVFILKFFIREK